LPSLRQTAVGTHCQRDGAAMSNEERNSQPPPLLPSSQSGASPPPLLPNKAWIRHGSPCASCLLRRQISHSSPPPWSSLVNRGPWPLPFLCSLVDPIILASDRTSTMNPQFLDCTSWEVSSSAARHHWQRLHPCRHDCVHAYQEVHLLINLLVSLCLFHVLVSACLSVLFRIIGGL